jgi:hypothetical protein
MEEDAVVVDELDDDTRAPLTVEGPTTTKTKTIPWVAPRLDPEYYQAQVQDLGTMYGAPSTQLVEGDSRLLSSPCVLHMPLLHVHH